MSFSLLEHRNCRLAVFYFTFIIWLSLYLLLQTEYGNIKLIGQIATILLLFEISLLIIRTIVYRNIVLLVFFVFMVMYTSPPRIYFFNELYFSMHYMNFSYSTAVLTTLIFSLFLIVLNLFLIIPPHSSKQFIPYKNNNVIFWICYTIAFIIVIICRRANNAYVNPTEAMQMSPLNEYVIILFYVCCIFSNNEIAKKRLLIILYSLYVFYALIAGGRVEIVLLAILIVITTLQFRWSFKKITFFLILGIWGMTLFGTIRHNPRILLELDIPTLLFSSDKGSIYQTSNEGDVYWASERLLILMDEGELPFSTRMESLMYYILSPIIPSSIMPASANLATYKVDIYSSGGGGLAPIVFYVMAGWIGVLILGIFISKMLNILNTNDHYVLKFYSVLMIITIPRWFAYNPSQLIKMCVIGAIGYFLINCIDYTFKRYNLLKAKV